MEMLHLISLANAKATATAAPQQGGRRVRPPLLAPLLALALLALGCAAPPPEVVTPGISGAVATLEDERRPLPNGQVAWSTSWRLCWAAYPGALAYELGVVTGEGTSRKVVRQSERCVRIEAAAGEADHAELENQRAILLSMQAGQLGYRVRAVLPNNRVSAWSPPYAVGKAFTARLSS